MENKPDFSGIRSTMPTVVFDPQTGQIRVKSRTIGDRVVGVTCFALFFVMLFFSGAIFYSYPNGQMSEFDTDYANGVTNFVLAIPAMLAWGAYEKYYRKGRQRREFAERRRLEALVEERRGSRPTS